MTLSALVPTGSRVKLSASDTELDTFFPEYALTPCASGTAALALAIQQACLDRDIAQPEVILPAYGCPDLIAACEFAQVRPILVDLQTSTSWMDLSLVASAITQNTVAIVAVAFLGIRERISDLQQIIDGRAIALIEDSAQWCPSSKTEHYNTELAIMSFGRGKPVSMIGGGLLLIKRSQSKRSKSKPLQTASLSKPQKPSLLATLKYKVKARLFNAILQPFVYGFVSKLPFLSIGETRYKPLDSIEPMPADIELLLSANLAEYQNKSDRSEQLRNIMANELIVKAGVLDLGAVCGVSKNQKQLRFPILFPTGEQRDECLRLMLSQGLGASAMYGKSLFNIDQVSTKASLHQADTVAQDFAKRVLTLPTHEFVNDHHLKKMERIIKDLIQSA